jgi:hypothetical protein
MIYYLTFLVKMSLEIIDYSEKAILVKGDTKAFKTGLADIKGKWNSTLNGWIFPKVKRSVVDEFVTKANSCQIKKEEIKVENRIVNNKDVVVMEKGDYLSLVSRLEKLEAGFARLVNPKGRAGMIVVEKAELSSDSSEESEEEEVPKGKKGNKEDNSPETVVKFKRKA